MDRVNADGQSMAPEIEREYKVSVDVTMRLYGQDFQVDDLVARVIRELELKFGDQLVGAKVLWILADAPSAPSEVGGAA